MENSTWTCPSLFTRLTSRSKSVLNGPASQYTILIQTGSSESLRTIPGYPLGGEFSHRSDLERTQRIDPSGRLLHLVAGGSREGDSDLSPLGGQRRERCGCLLQSGVWCKASMATWRRTCRCGTLD